MLYLHFKNTGKNLIFKVSNQTQKGSMTLQYDHYGTDFNPTGFWYSFAFSNEAESKNLYRRFSYNSNNKIIGTVRYSRTIKSKNHVDITNRIFLKRRIIISLDHNIAVQISCGMKHPTAMLRIRKLEC
jgi:hypothetical protein